MTSRATPKTRAARGLGPSDDRLREVIASGRVIIAGEGLSALTMRRLADVAGFTTGALMHHFPDKRSVVTACFEGVTGDWIERVRLAVEHAKAGPGPHSQITAIVSLAFPPPGLGRDEWPLWMEMWILSAREPALATLQHRTNTAWEDLLRVALEHSVAQDVLDDAIDLDVEARLLARLIDGLGLWAWKSGEWEVARAHLLHHFSHLGLAPDVARRVVEEHTTGAAGVWAELPAQPQNGPRQASGSATEAHRR